jgi:hypothetical protein
LIEEEPLRIRISLPDNRDYAGRLEVLDANGVVFGPVPAAGRAHDDPAPAHGNASRNPLRPYGDTPLGTYAVRGIVESGAGTGLDSEEYGSHGVVLLEPRSGQAALADAHGRLRLFIQGGSRDGLRATAGAVRLRDLDQQQLVALLRREPGRVRCEILPTPEQGAKILLTPPPLGRDPPALLGRSFLSPRASALLSRAPMPALGTRVASYAPRMFVMPVRSGSSGQTDYGSSGTTAGGDQPGSAGTGASNTNVGPINTSLPPLPATGDDMAPTPGQDLNPAPDQTEIIIGETGGSQLLSTAAATGVSDPFPPPSYNWYTDTFAGDPTLAPYTGDIVGTFSGDPPPQGNSDGTATGQLADEYSSTSAPAPGAQGTTFQNAVYWAPSGDDAQTPSLTNVSTPGTPADAAATLVNAQGTGPETSITWGPSDGNTVVSDDGTQAMTIAYGPQRDTIADPDAQIQAMVVRFYLNDADLNAQQDQNQIQSQSPPVWPLTIPPSFAPSPTLPGGTQPSAVSSPPRIESTGAWARSNPSQAALAGINEQINMGFLDPSLANANIATGTAQTPESINRLIWGQTGEITAYDYRLAQGEVGILAPNGITRQGLDYATASQLPNGDYQINYGDTASRYTSNPFKTSPGAPKGSWQQALANEFGPNGNFSLPGNPAAEQGIRDAFAAGRFSPVQIDTVDYSPQGQGRLNVNGVAVDFDPTIPPALGGSGSGQSGGGGTGGGGFWSSPVGGAAAGAGISTLINAGQILWNPDAHPNAAQELGNTAIAGGLSGYAGNVIQSALAPELGAGLAGGVAAGPAAGLFTVTQMALSGQDYTAEDYEAKGIRSTADGVFGSAFSAGLVGAIGFSEVPILGTAVGFAAFFVGALAFDAIFGQSIEDSVRSQPEEEDDGPNFGYTWSQGVGIPDFSGLE